MNDHEINSEVETTKDSLRLEIPIDRKDSYLDSVISNAIEDIPIALRMRPDAYAWYVADAVLTAIANDSERISPSDLRRIQQVSFVSDAFLNSQDRIVAEKIIESKIISMKHTLALGIPEGASGYFTTEITDVPEESEQAQSPGKVITVAWIETN